jgi:hypothetical protein
LLGLKYLDPGPGWKKTGSGINIPNPQFWEMGIMHCIKDDLEPINSVPDPDPGGQLCMHPDPDPTWIFLLAIEKYVDEWVVNLKSLSNIDFFSNFFETLIKW